MLLIKKTKLFMYKSDKNKFEPSLNSFLKGITM